MSSKNYGALKGFVCLCMCEGNCVGVFACVCAFECVSVSVYITVPVCVCVCLCVCMYGIACLQLYLCVLVSTRCARVCVDVYVSTYVCVDVRV